MRSGLVFFAGHVTPPISLYSERLYFAALHSSLTLQQKPVSRSGPIGYAAAVVVTSRRADMTSSVAVCWIMWPFPASL